MLLRIPTLLLLFLFALPVPSNSQATSSQILHEIDRLAVNASVLYIAAHPDDENTGLLAWLSHERKVRAAYLSLTRGDGGQNLIGPEQAEAVGLMRTRELMAARNVDGAEQFFTRAYDFGYSKNPEETLQLWNKDSILSDVVWVIRLFRPDVIIARFPSTGEGGHGHHTASAILAREAFDLAADPKAYAWQLTYVKPWKARRLFWNSYRFNRIDTTSPDHLKITTGQYNPNLGVSYGELAARSRSQHRCQGMGSTPDPAERTEYFKLLAGDSVKNDLLDGVETSYRRYPGMPEADQLTAKIKAEFDPRNPQQSLNDLAALHRLCDKIQDEVWRSYRQKQIGNLMLACSGLWLTASATRYYYQPGDSVRFRLRSHSRQPGGYRFHSLRYGTTALFDSTAKDVNRELSLFLPEKAPLSSPYWLETKRTGNIFPEGSFASKGLPVAENPNLMLTVVFGDSLNRFSTELPLRYRWTDPERGQKERPVEIVPAVSLRFMATDLIFQQKEDREVRVEVLALRDSVSGQLELLVPDGYRVTLPSQNCPVLQLNERREFRFTLSPQDKNLPPLDLAKLQFISADGDRSQWQITEINYDHIPPQILRDEAQLRLHSGGIKSIPAALAYIPGAGDDLVLALEALGHRVSQLPAQSSLQIPEGTKAVITGVRLFNTEAASPAILKELLRFCEAGGTVLVQYQTENGLKVNPGPYPLMLSRYRVTNENAEVRLLRADHPALNYPNRIGAEDFRNWVQERGLYFPGKPSNEWIPLLSMSDPGEEASDNALLVAPYGKGKFVYCSLSLFRQLPAGVPGAYKLLENLIQLGSAK